MATFKIAKTVLSSLFKKPATLMYPVIAREWQEKTRGHIDIDIDACIFCGICAKKCPTDAIAVERPAKSWTIQRMRCIQCSNCVDVCPKKCLTNENAYTTPNTQKVVDTFIQPEKEAAPEKGTEEAV